jgi:Na+-translocating ferredoxin:NAD+ oxidoreductase RnfG subunit
MKVLKLALFLGILSVFITGVSIVAYSYTAPIIEQNKIDKINTAIALLFNPEEYSRNETPRNYFVENYDYITGVYEVVDQEGELEAIIYDTSVYGKGGDILTLIAVDPFNDTIIDVVYYTHSETPGIGALYTEDEARLKLQGQSVDNIYVDAIVGATITWTALDTMVQDVMLHYNQEGVHIDG